MIHMNTQSEGATGGMRQLDHRSHENVGLHQQRRPASAGRSRVVKPGSSCHQERNNKTQNEAKGNTKNKTEQTKTQHNTTKTHNKPEGHPIIPTTLHIHSHLWPKPGSLSAHTYAGDMGATQGPGHTWVWARWFPSWRTGPQYSAPVGG